MKAVIINYGVGNLFSISSALKRVGLDVDIKDDIAKNWREYDLVILPGVGTFKAVATYFNKRLGIFEDIKRSGMMFLGICVGMQIMFDYGHEGGFNKGLGWVKGYVDKLKTNLKLPHIGWDKVYITTSNNDACQRFMEIDKSYMYFIHSYVVYPAKSEAICMFSYYGEQFPALIIENNIVGTQFHPEKSSKSGIAFLRILAQWLKC
uniref:Imidazole glycerol phosphate synthase subunit HisH n=1 Tax=Ignisphaera aggregans TaxID=334771 RepID=A0A7C5TF22_9CREN